VVRARAQHPAFSASREAGCGVFVVGRSVLGFGIWAFYLQNTRFLEWRDPDSNRGHHDFQICPETHGSPP
jgi:hypothetical protein